MSRRPSVGHVLTHRSQCMFVAGRYDVAGRCRRSCYSSLGSDLVHRNRHMLPVPYVLLSLYVRTKLEMPDNHATLDIRTREEARHLTVD